MRDFKRFCGAITTTLGVLVLLQQTEFTEARIGSPSAGACEAKLRNCTDMVHPFLNDLKYMFPTSIQDVDGMCKMWSQFVDCVRRYVTDCATEDQKARFNTAVGDSIDTVHAICSSDRYQREYLQNAACFRKVSVDHCGAYYTAMVDQVMSTVSNNDHICCSYSQFKSCVSEPLLRLCGSRARTIMDHSMAFLIHRCGKTYYSLSYKCPTAPPSNSNLVANTSTSSATNRNFDYRMQADAPVTSSPSNRKNRPEDGNNSRRGARGSQTNPTKRTIVYTKAPPLRGAHHSPFSASAHLNNNLYLTVSLLIISTTFLSSLSSTKFGSIISCCF